MGIAKFRLASYGFLALLIGAFTYSVYLDSEELAPPKHQVKQLEVKSSMLRGYKDSNLTWQIDSDYIWAGRSRYIYHAKDVQDGLIFNRDNRVIIEDVKANWLKVNTRHKTLKAKEGVTATFLRRENGEIENEISVISDELDYFNATDRVVAKNNVTLVQDDTQIFPKHQVSIDLEMDQAILKYGFHMKSDDFTLTGNHMVIFLNEDKAELSQGVTGKRFKKSKHDDPLDGREEELRAKETFFSSEVIKMINKDYHDDIVMTGNVVINQDDKTLKADYVRYEEDKDLYIAEGNVRVEAASIKWILGRKQRDNFDNDDVLFHLNQPIRIAADRLLFDANYQSVKLIGNVRITQDNLDISCQKVSFNDDTSTLELLGKVIIDRTGEDRVRAKKITINVDTEEVIAEGAVESIFLL